MPAQTTHATGTPHTPSPMWIANLTLLWMHRRLFGRVAFAAVVLSGATAFLLPKQYESSTSILPPEQTGSGMAMLAALAGKSSGAGGLAGLAGSMIGGRNNGALFLNLLHSGTVTGHIIDHFHLQHVYGKRYVEDTAKKLDRKTAISEDAKSGVITIVVEDTDRARARDMAQAYVDELNALVAQVDTSSAHREREFVEQRLKTATDDLQQAEMQMSRFSTKNATIDIKEQTRAMVDAGARLQGQLVASKSELDSLEQIYGSQNVRVRSAEARVGVLQRELTHESEGVPLPSVEEAAANTALPYPALRQLPGLAVPWEDLYRRVRIAETVYEMLSAERESARIEEARSIPTLRVIDPPGWPEKKSSPHRLLIIATSTALALMATSLLLLMRRAWLAICEDDPRRVLIRDVAGSFVKYAPSRRGAAR